jgi:glycosyltransferase involved in cell wall biosynthesis
MRVLLVPSFFPTPLEPHRAGYVRDYALSLGARHDVTVLYPQQVGAEGAPKDAFHTETAIAPRVRLIHFGYRHRRRTWVLSYAWAVARAGRALAATWAPDVVFAHTALPGGVGARALGLVLRRPVMLLEHWGPAWAWMGWPPYYRPAVPVALQRGLLGWTYRGVDLLCAVSEALARDLETTFRTRRASVLFNPVDCDLFRPDTAAGAAAPRVVLCVTRGNDPRKGTDTLLSAWERVQAAAAGAELHLVGTALETAAAEVKARGLGATCRIAGWLEPEALAAAMRRASLVVIPSTYETFGRSGAEALASGVPVVSTRSVGPEEYVREGEGLLVAKEDPAALAEGILAGLVRERFLPAAALAESARERFGYDAVCRRFTELAGPLTGGAPAPVAAAQDSSPPA